MDMDPAQETDPGKPFTICGVTRTGSRFRPSDWSCRLAGAYGKVVGNVIRYHPDVQPIHCGGNVGVRVYATDPGVVQSLLAFAIANDLVVENHS